jgi:hypothetical protein
MMDRTQLQAFCDWLQKRIDATSTEIAAIDAELAKLPEGWTDATEVDHNKCVRVLFEGWNDATGDGDIATECEAVAWWSLTDEYWCWPGTTKRVKHNIVAWKPLSLDWLAAHPAAAKGGEDA